MNFYNSQDFLKNIDNKTLRDMRIFIKSNPKTYMNYKCNNWPTDGWIQCDTLCFTGAGFVKKYKCNIGVLVSV